MITNPNEYWSLLYRIQDQNFPYTINSENYGEYHNVPLPIPSEETIYKIDLETRLIQAPKFLSVQHEHDAEWIWFSCPRYFDHIDLTTTCCVIQYVKQNGDEKVYPVPFYDALTCAADDQILIPWALSKDATECEGTLKFSIRFYSVDFDHKTFLYSLNTQPAISKILPGLNIASNYQQNFKIDELEMIWAKIAELTGDYNLYWLEAGEQES